MESSGAGGGPWANPRWAYPEYPPGSVVELRVHGVGGEPPSSMARDPHPVLVGGSPLAGFFRARNPVIGTLPGTDATVPEAKRPLHVREVLSWGGQTSGTVRHALWVLLLPFALFNVAGRMHLPADPRRARGHRAVCRALAVTMTLAVTAIVVGMAFDLLAVQCGGQGPACLGTAVDGPAWLGPLRHFEADVVGRLGVASLLPVAVVLGLWYAGRYRTHDLEGCGPGQASSGGPSSEPTSLADPDFWRNVWPASRLRALHASAAFAVIAATLAAAVLVVGHDSLVGGVRTFWVVNLAVAAAAAVAAVVLSCFASLVTPGPSAAWHRGLALLRLASLGPLGLTLGAAALGRVSPKLGSVHSDGIVAVLLVGGLGLALWWAGAFRRMGTATGGSAFVIRDVSQPGTSIARANWPLAAGSVAVGWAVGWWWTLGGIPDAYTEPLLGALPPSLPLPGWAAELMPGVFVPAYLALLAVVVLQVVLVPLLAIFAAGSNLPRASDSRFDDGGPMPRNLTAAVVALLSLFLITAVGAGLHALVLDLLGEPVAAVGGGGRDPEVADLVLPWWYAITALTVAFMPVMAAGALWWWARYRMPGPVSAADVRGHLTPSFARAGLEVPDPAGDAERLTAVGRNWRTQRLIRDGGRLLAAVVFLTLVVVVVALVWYRLSRAWGTALPLTSLAVWLTSAIPLLGFGLLRRALRDPETRRGVGRLWDVLTFWPRVTHPFAPPAYGEALVPLLQRRVNWLLERPEGYRVVVAGHSQGSVVSLAALASLPTGAARRPLALVSYGSPIAILYERYFPATLRTGEHPGATSVLDDVVDLVQSWHHVFALTEPFAYPFWTVSPDASAEDLHLGWPASRGLPFVEETCPVCVPDGTDDVRRCDLLVRDPDRWLLPDGSQVTAAGHSSYHRHPDVDLHLAQIAASLVGMASRSRA